MAFCGKSAGSWGWLALLVAAALLMSAAALNGAEIKRIYPPYPDVWGRVLPFPNDNNYDAVIEAYEMQDGIIRFHLGYNILGPNKPLKFALFDFFSESWRQIDMATEYRIRREIPDRRRLDYSLTLPDGGKIENKSEAFSNCRDTWDIHLVKRDPTGRIVADKMLLALYDRPVRVGIMPRCAYSEGREEFIAKWRQLDVAFAKLRDGTFLTYYNEPFIIRFRSNLSSPFIDKHPKLFLVDRARILTVVKKALARPGHPLQNVDDAVYDYLMTLK